ncbi:hypothetical protein NOR_03323 [Metarhizium rileyi]|uniref:Uncharacterized protein n=1 Tax=Metarhizium rileyi (strain RCEF 4871) TaxID=1649241 RepID=A0A167FNP4_METRR|nr:hypothetical protein NOR_03323 [Metarhizium rileyi RCEF 4871]
MEVALRIADSATGRRYVPLNYRLPIGQLLPLIPPGSLQQASDPSFQLALWKFSFTFNKRFGNHHHHASIGSTKGGPGSVPQLPARKSQEARGRLSVNMSRRKHAKSCWEADGRKSTRAHFERFARNEFSRSLGIEKRDFAAIEFLLRKGRRQLDVYSNPGIKDVR